jgi:hypothetical protein
MARRVGSASALKVKSNSRSYFTIWLSIGAMNQSCQGAVISVNARSFPAIRLFQRMPGRPISDTLLKRESDRRPLAPDRRLV